MKRQRPNKRNVIVGITGSFGSGKTTLAGIFRSYGAKLINADKLAHRCLIPGTSTYKSIISAFGRGVLKENKSIDRRKLSAIVFNNKKLLLRLNNIIHPRVIRAIKDKVKRSKSKVIVLDVPLLIESGLNKIVDKLIVVKTNRRIQIERIQDKTSLSCADILKRIKSQIPLRQKMRLADFVIDNSGSIKETKKQTEKIRRVLWKS